MPKRTRKRINPQRYKELIRLSSNESMKFYRDIKKLTPFQQNLLSIRQKEYGIHFKNFLRYYIYLGNIERFLDSTE